MSSKTQMIPLVTSSLPSETVKSLLDCGCGRGKWAGVLRTHLPQVSESYIVGLDIFRENLKFVQKYGAYDDLVVADIKHLPFKEQSFGVVLAAEVIEHIQKADGMQFLSTLEHLALQRVIVTTPNGSWPENPTEYSSGIINLYENHQSSWSVNDFRYKGYKVRAIGLRINSDSNSFGIQQIISGIDFLLFPGWVFPYVGKHLVAYKVITPS